MIHDAISPLQTCSSTHNNSLKNTKAQANDNTSHYARKATLHHLLIMMYASVTGYVDGLNSTHDDLVDVLMMTDITGTLAQQ